jgi:protein-tyrosine phosphatase
VSARFRVLIVCLGNICRSPMAEGVLRHKLEAAGWADRVEVDSAGTGSWHVGQPPDARAIRICRENGIAIEGLRGRQVAARDFEDFDLILCADRGNLRHLHAIAPRASWPRIALLLEWGGIEGPSEVPDPYDGTLEDFRDVHRMLDAAAEAILTKLKLPA